jgi:hypothetical protein
MTTTRSDEPVRVCDQCFHALAFYKELRNALCRHTSIFTSTAAAAASNEPHPHTVVDVLKAARSRHIQRDGSTKPLPPPPVTTTLVVDGGSNPKKTTTTTTTTAAEGFFSWVPFPANMTSYITDSGDGSSIIAETVSFPRSPFCVFPSLLFLSLSFSLSLFVGLLAAGCARPTPTPTHQHT